jgi:hypothetical protein
MMDKMEKLASDFQTFFYFLIHAQKNNIRSIFPILEVDFRNSGVKRKLRVIGKSCPTSRFLCPQCQPLSGNLGTNI